jgi:hypothetical protein
MREDERRPRGGDCLRTQRTPHDVTSQRIKKKRKEKTAISDRNLLPRRRA